MKVWLATALSLSAIVSTGSLYAEDASLGRVISRDPIEIDGIRVPARSYMPVNAGSTITTHSSAASIQFADGSTGYVDANTQIRLQSGAPYIKLVSGKSIYGDRSPSQTVTSARLTSNPVATTGGTVLRVARPTSTLTLNSGITGLSPRTPGTNVNTLTGQIILPSGIIINISYTGTNTSGSGTNYTVTGITVPTSTGVNPTTSTVTNNPLVGSTVTLVGTGASSTVTFTTSSGTPINSTTVQTDVTTAQNSVPGATTTGNVNGTNFSAKS